MNPKQQKVVKLVTCGVCALMYVAGLVMFFLKNFAGGLSAVVFASLAGLCALYYFRALELSGQQRDDPQAPNDENNADG